MINTQSNNQKLLVKCNKIFYKNWSLSDQISQKLIAKIWYLFEDSLINEENRKKIIFFWCKSHKIYEDIKHIYHAKYIAWDKTESRRKRANDMRSRDIKTKRKREDIWTEKNDVDNSIKHITNV